MKKKKFAAADCETDPFSLEQGTDIKPFIWGIFDGDKYCRFNSTEDFVNHIKAKQIDIYAHNGGKFDWMFLLDYLEKTADEYGETAQDVKIINGRISKLKIGRATLYDSYNILPVPLAAFSKDKFEYWKLEKAVRAQYMDEIEKYLESDCKNLYEFIHEFKSRFKEKITLASTAAGKFKELVGEMPESDESYHDTFKEYYYGGRVTPFEIGVIESPEKKIKFYDINSAYPTAMLDKHPYGTRLDKDVINMGDKLPPKQYIKNCFIELECSVLRVNNMNYGCFPVRTKEGLEFPLGRHEFKVTGWEYLAALDTKAIKDVKIKQVWWFTDILSFKNYVDTFYKEKAAAKEAGDVARELFAKLFLNSMYGKFCQDSRKFKQYKIVSSELAEQYIIHGSIDGELANEMELEENDILEEWALTNEFANNMCIIETPLIKEHSFYNVATGASITGWVRAFMWRSLCAVERPLYCDTDSIACFDGAKLPLGKKLGEWDLELKNIGKMAIAGKKLYATFGEKTNKDTGKLEEYNKTACKGVRLDAFEIELVAKGQEVLYRKESPVFSISNAPRMLTRYVNRKDKKKENEQKRKVNTLTGLITA